MTSMHRFIHPRRNSWRALVCLLLLGCVLFNNGCANDAFIPPPEDLPQGQTPPEPEPAPLQPPGDL